MRGGKEERKGTKCELCKPLSSVSKTFLDFVFFHLNCTCVQALPEAAAKYGDEMISLSDYFRKDLEGKLIESIRQICKIVAPDTILAELDPVYFTITGGFDQFLCVSSTVFAPVFRLFSIEDNTRQDKTTQHKTRTDKAREGNTRQDKTRHDTTMQGSTTRNGSRRNETKKGKTRQNNTKQDKNNLDNKKRVDNTRPNKTTRDKTKQEKARQEKARQGNTTHHDTTRHTCLKICYTLFFCPPFLKAQTQRCQTWCAAKSTCFRN
jgi:hypothetical protein